MFWPVPEIYVQFYELLKIIITIRYFFSLCCLCARSVFSRFRVALIGERWLGCVKVYFKLLCGSRTSSSWTSCSLGGIGSGLFAAQKNRKWKLFYVCEPKIPTVRYVRAVRRPNIAAVINSPSNIYSAFQWTPWTNMGSANSGSGVPACTPSEQCNKR